MKKLVEHYLAQKRHRGKSRVMKALMTIVPFPALRSHYGPVLCCNPQDRTNVYAISGDYGHIISDHIKSLPATDSFIDIGANYGLFTFLAAVHMRHVYAFEPNPEIYKYLSQAASLNKSDNVTLLNCAVGTEDGTMTLRYDKNHSGTASLATGSQNANDNTTSFEVKVINIANAKNLEGIENAQAIHIKIDVEGYESAIIGTLRKAPWFSKVQSLVVEIDNKNLMRFSASAKELYATLENEGLRPTIGLNENKHYDEIFVRTDG